jgi:uncharacterized protein YecE (DUF72 family)
MEKLYFHNFFSGLSGIQLLIPRSFYPPPYKNASRLTYYSSLFNSIEINSTFYKIPRPATVAKWAESVDEDFKFTFKMWRKITHCKGFDFEERDVANFFKSINSIGNKRGCLLIQLPPSIGKEYNTKLNKLLSCIKVIDSMKWKIAIEFRNKSWYIDSSYNLLDFFKAALVIHDIPKSATPGIHHPSEFVYVRLHGPTGDYRGSYSEYLLRDYANRVSEWTEDGKEVYMYFNNTIGDAYNNLKTINDFVCTKNHDLILPKDKSLSERAIALN